MHIPRQSLFLPVLAPALTLALTLALLAATGCGKSGFQEAPPALAGLTAYNRNGAALLKWDPKAKSLVESAPTGPVPGYDYTTNIWIGVDGQQTEGPVTSFDDKVINSRLRTESLKLDDKKKVLGITCLSQKREICLAAVCKMKGDALQGYDLRVCDDKVKTTAGCKLYQVKATVSTACPVYFFAAPGI